MGRLVCLFMCLICVGSANASLVVVDDFNDGVTTGWTTRAGTFNESGGMLTGSNGSLITLDGVESNSIGVDAISNPGVDYISLVLNYTSLSDNLFVKIQDNDSNGLFDRVFFYNGNNGSNGLVGDDWFELEFEVSSTFFEVTDNGDGSVSAFVGATGQTFGGLLTNSYSGRGVGLGIYGNGQVDNFYMPGMMPVPEPALLALFGLGVFGIGFSVRKK